MPRESSAPARAGWLVTAQSIGAAGSLLAMALTLNKPVQYVSDLAAAVDRLAEVAARLDASTRRQDERLTALEQGMARLSVTLEETRRAAALQEARLHELERRR